MEKNRREEKRGAGKKYSSIKNNKNKCLIYLLYLLHSIASSFSTVRFSRKEIQKTMTLVVGEAGD